MPPSKRRRSLSPLPSNRANQKRKPTPSTNLNSDSDSASQSGSEFEADRQDEIERNLCERRIYDDFWYARDEKNLQEDFAGERESLVTAMTPGEISLWRKSLTLFRLTPWHILPPGVNIDTKMTQALVTSDDFLFGLDGDGFKDLLRKNWANDFCSVFGNIILSEPFRCDLPLLRYTISYVLNLRLGSKLGFPRPSKPDFLHETYKDFERLYNEAGGFPLLNEEFIKIAIKGKWGDGVPEHFKFIENLNPIVKKIHLDQKGLIKKDLDNIVQAWDLFAKENPQLSLKSIKEYSADWNARGSSDKYKKYDNKKVPAMKKMWLLGLLRTHAKNQRRESENDAQGDDSSQANQSPIAAETHRFAKTPQRSIPSILITSANTPSQRGVPSTQLSSAKTSSLRGIQSTERPSAKTSAQRVTPSTQLPSAKTSAQRGDQSTQPQSSRTARFGRPRVAVSPELGDPGREIEESPVRSVQGSPAKCGFPKLDSF